MPQLRLLSLLMTGAGAALLAAAVVGAGSPVLALIGLLLVWAGLVKLVVVRLWRHLDRPVASRPDD